MEPRVCGLLVDMQLALILEVVVSTLYHSTQLGGFLLRVAMGVFDSGESVSSGWSGAMSVIMSHSGAAATLGSLEL